MKFNSILLICFLSLAADMFIMRIYAAKARQKYIKIIKNIKNKRQVSPHNAKRNIFNRYLTGFVYWQLRLIGYLPSIRLRRIIYKKVFLMKLSPTSIIHGGVEMLSPWNIKIGNYSIIGNECKLDGRQGIIIKDNVNFSTGVWCWTDQHQVNSRDFSSLDKGSGKIIIENRCWCGPRSMILPGKHMREGSVLCGNGVLTKDTQAFGIYAGVPAIKKGERDNNIDYQLSQDYMPFY